MIPRYTLIQVFSKFGKLVRLDYLFHKTGALRGKPRGYAFVEYLNDQVSPLAHPLAAREEKKE
jgi:RNA recognition motif-containing protein